MSESCDLSNFVKHSTTGAIQKTDKLLKLIRLTENLDTLQQTFITLLPSILGSDQ